MALDPGSGSPIVNSWTPGTTYPPGSVIRPTSAAFPGSTSIQNDDFESGLTNWTADAGWTSSLFAAYDGSLGAELAAGSGTADLLSDTEVAVVPGQVINAQCYYNSNSNASGTTACLMGIAWFDSSHVYISTSTGSLAPSNVVHTGPYFAKFAVRAVAPSSAAYAKFSGKCTNSGTNSIFLDLASWDYLAPVSTSPLVFYAVQTGTGKSGAVEPTWATTPPNITDGTCVWSSQKPTSILWSAAAIMTSNVVEPIWPTTPGAIIRDGSIDWVAVTPQVTDTNCPSSKYVFIGASKIFACDNDIVRFSATTDPMDWTTEADAGFLPTGLQNYGKNPFKAAGLYRSNGVFFNAEGLQMWQLDEDPANMALLDSIPIGSTQHRSLAPVNNDLFFLSAQGVRTMGISAGSGNLMAGDVGMPIDPLVQAAMTWATANSVTPIGAYYPGAGQYFLAFPNWPATGLFVDAGGSGTTSIFVYTMSRIGEVGAWSRYLVQFALEDFCQHGDRIMMRGTRSGVPQIFAFDPSSHLDSDAVGNLASTATIQWPWLDFGQPGVTKQMLGLDTVVSMSPYYSPSYTVAIGYDESNKSTFTSTCTLTDETLPGMFVPFPIMAPALSMRMTFDGDMGWEVQSVNIYLQDQRVTA